MLDEATAALKLCGVEPKSTYFDVEVKDGEPRPAPHVFMREAFAMIEGCDFLFVLQSSPQRSEGMLMEVGFCLAKGIPVLVARRSGFDSTYLPDMAQATFEWETIEQLAANIEQLDLSRLRRLHEG